MAIECEAAARHERAEAGHDERCGVPPTESRALFDPRHLSVGERVAEVRDDLRRKRKGEPFEVVVPHALVDLMKARGPGHPDDGEQAEGAAQREVERELRWCCGE